MSQRSRSRGGSGRRPKDLRTGPGRASPPLTRATGPARRGPTPRRQSRSIDPRLIAAAVAGGILIILALVLGGFFNSTPAATPSPSPGASVIARGTNCPTSQPPGLTSSDTRTVTIATAKGSIVIKVQGSLSPIATGNFVALASCGFYDGLVFHRLVPGFVIQGGDPNGDGSGGPGYTIADDPITASYHRGTVAMARTPDPHTQGSQFFIVLDDSAASALSGASPGYAILGEVTSGMDVVDTIAAMPNSGSPNNTATDPVAMTTVTVATP